MDPAPGISAFPAGDNLMTWAATIEGSDGTCYEGAPLSSVECWKMPTIILRALLAMAGLSYEMSVNFSEKYPFDAPTVKFITPCFHPNVDTAGTHCCSLLYCTAHFLI